MNQRLIDDDATRSTECRSKYKTPSSYMVNESHYRRSSSSMDENHLSLLTKSTTPEKILCPHCRNEAMTKVERRRSAGQICLTIFLCFFIIIGWPFAYLVWKSVDLMVYDHICSSCDRRISTFDPSKADKMEKKQRAKKGRKGATRGGSSSVDDNPEAKLV